MTREQEITLEGTVNLRDVGGHETRDGQRVRRRRLLRSDSLTALSGADVQVLAEFGLRSVIDLRDASERADQPNSALGPDVRTHDIGVFPVDMAQLFADLPSMEVEEVRAWMRDTYRAFVLEHRPAWIRLLETITAAGTLPALVHCTGGRDRTGVAILIVLSALDVPHAVIVADYMRSDVQHRAVPYLPGVAEDKLAALTRPDPTYLQAAVDAAVAAFGSLDDYLREGLSLDGTALAELRQALLE